MNKHELKSLLENIYYTLTEADDLPISPRPAPPGFVGPPAPPAVQATPIRYRPTSSTPIKTFPSFPGDNPDDIAEINRLLALIRSGRPDNMGQSIAVLEAIMRSLIQQVLWARQDRAIQPHPPAERVPPVLG